MTSISTPHISSYYHPPVQPQRHDLAREKASKQAPEEYGPQTASPKHPTSTTPSSGDALLGSVSQQGHQQIIAMGTILKDVHSTMDALGVSDAVRERVAKYMATIKDQALTTTPAKTHIHESLKVVGGILDSFITDALKQPSNVVKEWVNALLLQPIQYSDPTLKTSVSAEIDSPNPTEKAPSSEPTLLQADAEQHRTWKATIKNSKALLKTNQADQAAAQLLNVVGELEIHGEQALLANVLTGLAKAYKQTGQISAADTALQSAAQIYQNLNKPAKALLQWRNLAQLYNQAGQPADALKAYAHAAGIDSASTKSQTLNRSQQTALLKQSATLHNDWASLLFGQQKIADAKAQWKHARQVALQPNGPKELLPDIYSNFAHVFISENKLELAEKSLLQSMKAAQKLNDSEGYQASWQQLQTVYSKQQAEASG